MNDEFKPIRHDGYREKSELLHTPGGAMQADRLQVLFHSLVVLNLSWDRNGHCLAAVRTAEFSGLAAWARE